MTVGKLCALTALMGFIALGEAGTARAEYLEFGPLEAVSTVYISTTPAYGTYSNLDVYDGQYGAQLSPNLSMTPAQTFNTFCVDLADEVEFEPDLCSESAVDERWSDEWSADRLPL